MEAVVVESLEDTCFVAQLLFPEFLSMVAFYSFDHVATCGCLSAFAVIHPRVLIAVTFSRVPDQKRIHGCPILGSWFAKLRDACSVLCSALRRML